MLQSSCVTSNSVDNVCVNTKGFVCEEVIVRQHSNNTNLSQQTSDVSHFNNRWMKKRSNFKSPTCGVSLCVFVC